MAKQFTAEELEEIAAFAARGGRTWKGKAALALGCEIHEVAEAWRQRKVQQRREHEALPAARTEREPAPHRRRNSHHAPSSREWQERRRQEWEELHGRPYPPKAASGGYTRHATNAVAFADNGPWSSWSG